MDDIRHTREVLAQEALRLLARELKSVAVETFSEAGPYRDAAAVLAKVALRTHDHAHGILTAARSLPPTPAHPTDPAVDARLDGVEQILHELTREVVAKLADRFRTEDRAARVIRQVGAAVKRLGELAERLYAMRLDSRPDAAGEAGGEGSKTEQRTIVSFDLSRYSDLIRIFIDSLKGSAVDGPIATAWLNQQIKALIKKSIGPAATRPGAPVIVQFEGDGGIVVLASPAQADGFATRLHENAAAFNAEAEPRAQRHFRIGISTGLVCVSLPDPGRDKPGELLGGGMVVVMAKRFQEKCKTGEVLICPETYRWLRRAPPRTPTAKRSSSAASGGRSSGRTGARWCPAPWERSKPKKATRRPRKDPAPAPHSPKGRKPKGPAPKGPAPKRPTLKGPAPKGRPRRRKRNTRPD